MQNRRITLTKKLMILVVISALASGLIFVVLQYVGNQIMDKHFDKASYIEKQTNKTIEEFRAYVRKNHIASSDKKAFKQWAKHKKYIYMYVYKNGYLQYDSTYDREDESYYGHEVEGLYEKESAKKVIFTDGKADVIVYGFFSERYYNLVFIVEFAVACLVFLLLVVLGIRKEMHYIQKLNDEIHILEGGNLEYAITIQGNDELSMLAKSLDELREAFTEKLNAVKIMQVESRELVTEMAHDIRTPLTSLLMYLGFARDNKDDLDKEVFLEKAYDKALYIKNMSDDMFMYFLMDKEEEKVLETFAVKEAFYDFLSDMVGLLQDANYRVNIKMELPHVFILADRDYLGRIFNNLMSNILKYADESEEIVITCAYEVDSEIFKITICYVVKDLEEKGQSSGLGVKIINKMMVRMMGEYKVIYEEGYYKSVLKFKIVEKQAR